METKGSSTRRRRVLLGLAALGAAAALGLGGFAIARFPPETRPEGAYLRIAKALSLDDRRVVFSYLEDRAQHAAFTIRDYRARASTLVEAHYPEPERSRLLDAMRPFATAPDGADVWLILAEREGFIARLRKDLSGIKTLEEAGDRATIETAQGTRYTFRRRENGMWGLTLFTAALEAEAERAARDFSVIEQAAADYARGK